MDFMESKAVIFVRGLLWLLPWSLNTEFSVENLLYHPKMTESFCKHHGVQAPGKLLNVEGVFDFYKCCLEKVNQPYIMAGPPPNLPLSEIVI